MCVFFLVVHRRSCLEQKASVELQQVIERNLAVYEVLENILEKSLSRRRGAQLSTGSSYRGRVMDPIEVRVMWPNALLCRDFPQNPVVLVILFIPGAFLGWS